MPQSIATDSWESSEDDDQDEIGLNLAHELDGNILEVTPTSFFDAFLGSTSGTLEEKCLEALRDPESGFFQEIVESQLRAERSAVGSEHPDGKNYEAIRAAVLQRLPTYDQETTQFRHLAETKYGDDIYQPLASLLNFISHFYRIHLGAVDGVDRIDQEWPEATQTWPTVGFKSGGTSPAESGPSSQPRGLYLRRRFLALPHKQPEYTNTQDTPSVIPDLALVLRPSEDPRIPDPLGWRDIKVAIEAKPDFENHHIQTGRYAHCMKLEQFDRKFIFTLSITGEQFRITRWDTAACYVTPPINFHKDPLTFIHVIGRLASMNPAQLGYDSTFSNAGRVLYSQVRESNRGIRTILTVTPCQVSENLQISPRTRIAKPFQYLLDDDLLCDASDLLFCRSTRVWRAQLITDTGLSPQYNAIKQSWHDEARTNEAWFYKETKDIEFGVAHMLHFEDVCRTRHAPLSTRPNDVRATWTQRSEDRIILERKEEVSRLQNVSHRALIRIVLKEVGRPLSQLKTPRQLVHVLRDIVVVLEALYDRNIIHCDISEGNILLSPEENPDPGNRAFLTDFGLAARIDPITKIPLFSSMKQNQGTLPFMAAVLHQATPDFTPLSTIHNDVESLFWVAMYTLLKCAISEGYPDMSKSEEADIRRCHGFFAQLQSHDMTVLFAIKKQIISFEEEVRLPGRWRSIQNFLSKVASLCAAKFKVALHAFLTEDYPDPKEHDIHAIVIEADAVGEGSGESLDVLAP